MSRTSTSPLVRPTTVKCDGADFSRSRASMPPAPNIRTLTSTRRDCLRRIRWKARRRLIEGRQGEIAFRQGWMFDGPPYRETGVGPHDAPIVVLHPQIGALVLHVSEVAQRAES